MPSNAFHDWNTDRRRRLDALEDASRRWNDPNYQDGGIHALAVLLSAEFQGYCMELLSEAQSHIKTFKDTWPSPFQILFERATDEASKLDRGNPSWKNLRSDFARLGLDLNSLPSAPDGPAGSREQDLSSLDLLLSFRNGVAHANLEKLKNHQLTLEKVARARVALDRLAADLDLGMHETLSTLSGRPFEWPRRLK
jgi:hypothetical protein